MVDSKHKNYIGILFLIYEICSLHTLPEINNKRNGLTTNGPFKIQYLTEKSISNNLKHRLFIHRDNKLSLQLVHKPYFTSFNFLSRCFPFQMLFSHF